MSTQEPTIQRLGKDYTVTRHAPGAFVAGKFVTGPTQTFSLRAVITPAGNAQLQLLPEGLREKDTIRVFTSTDLHTADPGGNETADRINYAGRDYEVVYDSSWNGRFFECLAVRV